MTVFSARGVLFVFVGEGEEAAVAEFGPLSALWSKKETSDTGRVGVRLVVFLTPFFQLRFSTKKNREQVSGRRAPRMCSWGCRYTL